MIVINELASEYISYVNECDPSEEYPLETAPVPSNEKKLPVAYPDSEDFAAAVATIPTTIVELLDREFHATFTALIPITKEEILH
ncbi:MAG: hypothetical protein LBS59_00325 [Puniceicoccales bacterium]|jgi:hypothetical protein|nr:hypothetical protein [Puniceicoccales bacterium]